MNQRIVLPAIIIGSLFAIALGLARSLLPEAPPVTLFVVDAAVFITALLVYGILMREAAAAAARGKQTTVDAPHAQSKKAGRRSDGGDNRGRGARDTKALREESPSAPAGPREAGHIKWFSGTKGYGFIIRPNGNEIFVHYRALRDSSRHEVLDGQAVSYVVVERDKGPQADDVELTDAQSAENAA